MGDLISKALGASQCRALEGFEQRRDTGIYRKNRFGCYVDYK